jgi:hypothetical protein
LSIIVGITEWAKEIKIRKRDVQKAKIRRKFLNSIKIGAMGDIPLFLSPTPLVHIHQRLFSMK